MVFIWSGRLRVIVATPWLTLNKTADSGLLIVALPRRAN
jgi:hypothetical protein